MIVLSSTQHTYINFENFQRLGTIFTDFLGLENEILKIPRLSGTRKNRANHTRTQAQAAVG